MTDHVFLRPPLLQRVVTMTEVMENHTKAREHMEYVDGWTNEDLDEENMRTMVDLLEHIRGCKLSLEEYPGPCDHDHISIEIVHFWIIEAANYLIARGEIINDLQVHFDNPRLSSNIRKRIRKMILSLMDTGASVNVHSENRVFWIPNDTTENILELPALARDFLPRIPEECMSWKAKRNFMKNSEDFSMIPILCDLNLEFLATRITV